MRTQPQFVARVRPSTGSGPSEPNYLAAYSTPEDSGVKAKNRGDYVKLDTLTSDPDLMIQSGYVAKGILSNS